MSCMDSKQVCVISSQLNVAWEGSCDEVCRSLAVWESWEGSLLVLFCAVIDVTHVPLQLILKQYTKYHPIHHIFSLQAV